MLFFYFLLDFIIILDVPVHIVKSIKFLFV